jgi:hypothetical protein
MPDLTLLIPFLPLALAVIVLLLIGWIIRLEVKLRRLLSGKNGHDLESVLLTLKSEQQIFSQFKKDVEKYLTSVERRLGRSIQGIKTVRFNAFKGTGSGGNQSFATAFVNEEGDGVVFSSLYGRERVGIFAKPVKGTESEFELTDEEREALQQAHAQLK